jgi:hypothetical protein
VLGERIAERSSILDAGLVEGSRTRAPTSSGALRPNFRVLLKQGSEFLFCGADFLNRGQREHPQSFDNVFWRSQMLHDLSNIVVKSRNFPRF